MSDVQPSRQHLQWKLAIERPSLAYANKRTAREVIFAVSVPYPLLMAWYNLVSTAKSSMEADSTSSINKYLFVDLLEHSIPGHSFAITPETNIRSEVNESLRKLACHVNSEDKSTKGRKKKALESRTKTFHILQGQTVSIENLKNENQSLHDQMEEWKRTCENLQSNVRQLHQEMEQALREKDKEISDLTLENEELKNYIDKLQSSNAKYKGKDISEVQKKSRTLASFMSRAQVALWFAESFGLKLETLTVREMKTGIVHNLSTEKDVPHRFDDLSEDNKSKVETVLFLLDKFCVGDSFYHELSMEDDELPRSYLIKQRRGQLNNICHISSTPGDEEGAQVPFREILTERIRHYAASQPNSLPDGDCIKIKISGDGAQMTRNSNFILMSFALLYPSQDIMAAKGNHTIAVVNGKEDYSTLKTCFGDVFRDINELVNEKKIEIDGKTFNLEFFLGGDYKFLLILLGLSGATSNHACAWCKVHKTERWEMSYNLEHYNSPELKRTLEELKQLAGKKTKNYNCINPPLLHIDLDHVVMDELHLLLRVMDILIKNLIMDAVEWDQKENWGKRNADKTNDHLKHLIETINSCGISFAVWEKRNANGNGSGLYDFTSLMGDDKKKLLKNLPPKLQGVIRTESEETVKQLWEEFSVIYATVTCKSPSQEMIDNYFSKAQAWINLFISLRDKSTGYKKVNITPYMHIMVYHVPQFLQAFKSVKLFTGQGVEKNNDVARSTVLRKSNKWNSTEDVLKHEARLWELRDRERTKRVYNKVNMDYWEYNLPQARKNKRQKSAQ